MSKNYLSKNDELRRGEYLMSNNKQWKAVFQDDGNFVIYGWKPVWSSDTYGTDVFRLCMQADSNLVMYNQSGVPRWHTDTSKGDCNMCRLFLTDDGKLMLNKESTKIWCSDDNKGKK